MFSGANSAARALGLARLLRVMPGCLMVTTLGSAPVLPTDAVTCLQGPLRDPGEHEAAREWRSRKSSGGAEQTGKRRERT